MWAYQLDGPSSLTRVEVAEPSADGLAPGHVLLRFLAGSICGSDLPSFAGRRNPLSTTHGEPGYPMHEVVGEVVAVAPGVESPSVGDRVVGWSGTMQGLRELFPAPAGSLVVLDDRLPDDTLASVVQPLACVVYALDQLPDVAGRHVAVIGVGTLGVLFSRLLADRGAVVTGVDRVDRRDVADAFGIARPVWSDSHTWVEHDLADVPDDERPHVVIEAVGHQVGTLADAIEAVAANGFVYGFGVPDDSHYPLPYERLFRKGVTLTGGTTQDRRATLERARELLAGSPGLAEAYVTHRFDVADAQAAYEMASAPAAGRLKVVVETRSGG